ncbi:MAG: photosystem II protein PsbQ [Cyanobacteria bacterium P01_A01_bin.17]
MKVKFKQFCKSLLVTVCMAGLLLLTSINTLTPAAVAASDQVQLYTDSLQSLKDRVPELEPLIQSQNWNGIQTFIRGPLGELGIRLSRLEGALPKSDLTQYRRSVRSLQDHLQKLDVAASKKNVKVAATAYQSLLNDFEQIL